MIQTIQHDNNKQLILSGPTKPRKKRKSLAQRVINASIGCMVMIGVAPFLALEKASELTK